MLRSVSSRFTHAALRQQGQRIHTTARKAQAKVAHSSHVASPPPSSKATTRFFQAFTAAAQRTVTQLPSTNPLIPMLFRKTVNKQAQLPTPLLKRTLAFTKKHWFSLAFPPMLAFSYQWPQHFQTQGGTLQIDKWKDYAFMGIFISTGVGIKVRSLLPLAKYVKTHAFIQGAIFVASPLLFSAVAYGVLEPLGVPKPLICGFIFTSCLPTTIGTCLAFTSAAKGHAGVSMFHVVMSNLGGIFITPALCLALTGMTPSIDLIPLFTSLSTKVLLPVAAGIALGYRFPTVVGRCSGVLSKMPQMCVIPLLASNFSDLFAHDSDKLSMIDAKSLACVFAAAASVNWILMRGIHTVGVRYMQLPEPVARSAVFVGSQKTAALGVPLLGIMFANDPNLGLMMVPLMCYHAAQCAASSIFIAFLLA